VTAHGPAQGSVEHGGTGVGGGHCGTQRWFGCAQGCSREHVVSRHCIALVSKHVPFAGGGGHCSVQI
jgi:hypothetical protein